MKFNDMEYGFQEAFASAWRAYMRNTTPIGCAIVKEGELLASGENCIYASDGKGVLSGHHLAHAEINAVLQIDTGDCQDISDYTVYSTMEPCPFCFGAIVQGSLQRIKYAASDKQFGAASLNAPMEGIVKHKIEFAGPDPVLQVLQVILIIFRRLEKDFSHNGKFFDIYLDYCPEGVALGRRLFSDTDFYNMISLEEPHEKIYDYILSLYT